MRVFISMKKYSPSEVSRRRFDADRSDACAELRVDRGRGRLLDELLVAALDGAVTLAQVDDVPMGICEHLHLDVARVDDQLFDVHVRIREIRQALPARGLERPLGLRGRLDDLHPLAAASGRRLDQQRVADRLAERAQLLDRLDGLGGARDDRHARGLHRPARTRLRAHQLDRRRRRADPGQPRLLHRARERSVLGKEPITGVHRLCPGSQRRLHEHVDLQVALRRRSRPDQERLVRETRMQRVAICLRVHTDRAGAQLSERPEDTDGDLAAVRNQDLVEHVGTVLSRP
jgi:hypothetical protein